MIFASVNAGRIVGLIIAQGDQQPQAQPDHIIAPVPPGLPVAIGWLAEFFPPMVDYTFSPPPPVVAKIDFITSWPAGAVSAIGAATDPDIAEAWTILSMVDDSVDLGRRFVINAVDGALAWLVSQDKLAKEDLPAARAKILSGRIGE